MPRRPKPKNTLSAGERVALYEAEREKKMKAISADSDEAVNKTIADIAAEVIADAGNAPETESKPKKIKPKPQSALVKVDFSIPVGEVKPMHGMCNGPVSYGADISDAFREIGVPIVRFDCTDTAISRQAVDISRIFRNYDADPSDPDSYDFAETDKYVDAAMRVGAKIIYRLGESADILGAKPAEMISDVDTLARVCVNIIRHYRDGFAQGRYYDIGYFDILSCCHGTEDIADAMSLYGRLANAIKLYDESVRVGGMSFGGFLEARELIKAAKRNRYPLDFVTVDCFCGDPLEVGEKASRLVSFARNSGFGDLEVIVGKWAYFDSDVLGEADVEKVLSSDGESFRKKKKELYSSACSVKGAAYAAATMLSLNQTEGVGAACFYDAQPMISPFCSLTDRFGEPEKPFYAFKGYGELYRTGNAVLCSVESPAEFAHSGIYCSAAVSENGEGCVMIASFNGCGVVDLRLDGIGENVYSADVYMLDGVKNMTAVDSVPLSGFKKRLVLNISEYGAVLIKLH